MVCEPWDVVVVPFPFTETPGTKRRPAVVLSKKPFNENGHTILAMITTKGHHPWPGDTDIEEHHTAGLHAACMLRLKLFTLDNRLIVRQIGQLSENDRTRATERIRGYFV